MKLQISGTIDGRHRTWPLEGRKVSLGRSSTSGIWLSHPTVSKEHAEIVLDSGSWALRDLGSRNGTRVNGRPVCGQVALTPGDRIELGSVTLRATDEDWGTSTQFCESPISTSFQIPAREVLGPPDRPAAGDTPLVHLLAEAGRLLVENRSLKEVCQDYLKIVERAIPTSRLVVLLQDAPEAELVQVAARSRGGASGPLVLSGAILRSVLDRCTSVITSDAMEDPRFADRPSVVALGIRSAMAVPLFDNERALGLLYADQEDPDAPFRQDQLEVMTLFANMLAVKITNARLFEVEQRTLRLNHELAMASRIQRCFLPTDCPSVEGYEFHAHLETCEEVGGDLYDFHRMRDGSVYFVLGDVSGKGVCGALLTSLFLASVDVLYDSCADPGELASRLNDALLRRSDGGRFITAFIGRLDPGTGRVQYVNAGHPSPMLVDADGLRELESTGQPLGSAPNLTYAQATAELGPDSLLAVFSDGISEARRGEQFFELERLAEIVTKGRGAESLEDLSRGVLGRVTEFLEGAPRQDDIALMLVRRR